MNIAKLILLLLVGIGFTACSGDKEENEILGDGIAALTINLTPIGGVTTRAAENSNINPLKGESKINSYVICLYNGSDELLRILEGTNSGSVTINNLTAGTTLKVRAFTNLSDAAKKAVKEAGTVAKLNEIIEILSNQKTDNLTMACTAASSSITLQAGTNNTIEVQVARLVSRIQISSIQTKFAVANDYTVTVNSVSLKQVKTQSLLYTGGKAEVADAPLSPVSMYNQAAWTVANGKTLAFVTDGSEPAEGKYAAPYAYTFENSNVETPTQLLLNATLKDKDKNEISTRNFTVTINSDSKANHFNVKRNYIYDLGLTFNDVSFDMAGLVVKVTIVPWGSVKQEIEIE